MTEIDWVIARRDCGPRTAFARLLAGARRDVDIRNNQREENDAYAFKVSTEGGESFRVGREGRGLDSEGVRFTLTPTGIRVESSDDAVVKIKFDAKVGLNANGECRLFADGEELEEWQIRKRALEPLLFHVYRETLY